MMHKIFLIIAVFLIYTCPAQALLLVHTGDLHAHLNPLTTKGSDCTIPSPDCLGGFDRIKGLIDTYRTNRLDMLVLDAGDRFSGTLFYTLDRERLITKTLKTIGYDALTLGNHDFDGGLDELNRFVTGMDVPVVLANVSLNHPLQKHIQSHLIVDKNGEKIGIIGLLTPDIKTVTAQTEHISVHDINTVLKSEINALKKQHINRIIVLSHIGIELDEQLARSNTEIDIIVSAHSHTLMSNDPKYTYRFSTYPKIVSDAVGRPVLIVSAGYGGRFVGVLDVDFDADGVIMHFAGNAVPIDDTIPADSAIKTAIQETQSGFGEQLARVLGHTGTSYTFTPDSPYCNESCFVGEFLTDLMRLSVSDADVALLNAGGIRAEIPAGDITLKEMIQSLPFDSPAVMTSMTGQQLISYLEHGLKSYTPDDRVNALLHLSGGRYVFDVTSQRITSLSIGNKPVDLNQTYTVIISDFLTKGGDGFPVLAVQRIQSMSLRHMIMDTLIKKPDFHPNFENRVQIQH